MSEEPHTDFWPSCVYMCALMCSLLISTLHMIASLPSLNSDLCLLKLVHLAGSAWVCKVVPERKSWVSQGSPPLFHFFGDHNTELPISTCLQVLSYILNNFLKNGYKWKEKSGSSIAMTGHKNLPETVSPKEMKLDYNSYGLQIFCLWSETMKVKCKVLKGSKSM
jgi:hypothetical protein